jgi:hypothetical protein
VDRMRCLSGDGEDIGRCGNSRRIERYIERILVESIGDMMPVNFIMKQRFYSKMDSVTVLTVIDMRSHGSNGPEKVQPEP